MFITDAALTDLFRGFKTAFNEGLERFDSTWSKIAMEVPSSSREETYAWLGQMPSLREWIGDRIIYGLKAHGYTIRNRPFEMTITVPRDDIEDDRIGIFKPMFENMGYETKRHPDSLVYELLPSGFTVACYDGKPFFAEDHPVHVGASETVPVSNMQDGAGPAWYLIDGSRPFKPIIYQNRRPYEFVAKDRATDERVFNMREFLYGVDARASAGFGLWQLAFGSKADLTHENYEAARTAMKAFRGDHGKKLGVSPTILVVPDELEGDARRVVKNETRVKVVAVGDPATEQAVVTANEWADTADLVVSSFL